MTVTTDMEFSVDRLTVQFRTENRNREHSSIKSQIRIPVGTRICMLESMCKCLSVVGGIMSSVARNFVIFLLHIQGLSNKEIN